MADSEHWHAGLCVGVNVYRENVICALARRVYVFHASRDE